MSLDDLADGWKDRADRLREWAADERAATLWERAAVELEEAIRAHADEPLTLDEAAAESRYAKRTLREKIANGEIPNAGRTGAPRIRRGDLPRGPSRPTTAEPAGYDPEADADDLVGNIDPAA